jgi:hypothetical protein
MERAQYGMDHQFVALNARICGLHCPEKHFMHDEAI